jgi:hypothetical protein
MNHNPTHSTKLNFLNILNHNPTTTHPNVTSSHPNWNLSLSNSLNDNSSQESHS